MGSPYGSARKRSVLRSRTIDGRQFIKPLKSLEICLMGQLYKEHSQIDEYRLGSIPSAPTERPFLMSDGSRIISRASGDSFNLRNRIGENKLQMEIYSEDNETVFGIPPLPNIGSTKISSYPNIKTQKERGATLSSSSKMINGRNSNSQGSGAHIFSLGVSIGMISSFLANKREVDKLNELLKQTENLVQDLQEELEMKDSLTLKELVVEDYESRDTYNDSYNSEVLQTFFPEQNLDESTIYDDKKFNDQKAKEESLLQIEAELEAELERLEQNMNSSSLERKFSDLVELDPDFVPDIVEGEFRANMLTRKAGGRPHADRDRSGSSTAYSANYAVSPTELGLRLHQVLQSRLEERIKELEAELQNKEREVHYIESESIKSCRDFSNSESGSSSVQEQSMVINLAGEGLDVYGEAEEDGLHPFDQDFCWSRNGGVCYIPCHLIGNGSESTASVHQKGEDQTYEVCTSGDENGDGDGDGDGEMEKVLIKQIIDRAKARKGFPAVLNAQRTLFLMDQNETLLK